MATRIGTLSGVRRRVRWLAAALAFFGLAASVPRLAAVDATDAFPDWAYAWDPAYKAPPADNTPIRLAGSSASYSVVEARNLFRAPDWHPRDHPAMPSIVANGRRPAVRACGVCHRAEGTGGPENASLAGLPAAYITAQMADFKSGARRFSGPRRSPIVLMIEAAREATEPEVAAAAAYFSSLRPKALIDVIEADMVPATYIAGSFHVARPDANSPREPLGQRILEIPEDVRRFELRDTHARFRAYVPPGSLARGRALVETPRVGTLITCARCHGPTLRGLGQVPGIAGRSPSYLMRQLYDFKQGARKGVGRAQMGAVVAPLTTADMLAITAYLATLKP